MKLGLHTPTKIKGKRAYGFRKRMKSPGGRKVIRRRRAKGRAKLTV